jgi:hypothetical protein
MEGCATGQGGTIPDGQPLVHVQHQLLISHESSHSGAAVEEDPQVDEAGSVAIDYKRGKRLKKMTKLLLSAQVRQAVST